MLQLYKQLTKINTEFRSFFFDRELFSLQHRTTRGILLLTTVFLLSLVAISFSVGGIKFLNERMDNPLTNWLNVVVNSNNYEQLGTLQTYFESDSIKNNFNLKLVEDYKSFPIYFQHDNGGEYRGWGRSISHNRNPTLLAALLQPENYEQEIMPFGEEFNNYYSEMGGLIITKTFLKELGYESVEKVRKIPIFLEAANNKIIWVDILGIVKEIPGREGMNMHFICSPKFYNFYDKPGQMRDGSRHFSFISKVTDEANLLAIVQKNHTDLALKIDKEPFEIISGQTHLKYTIKPREGNLKKEALSSNLQKELPFFSRFYKWTSENKPDRLTGGDTSPDNVSFVFKDWRQIRRFKAFMQKEFDDFQISLLQVEEKENFNLVSRLTSGLAFFLFGFALLSTGIFIYNLLHAHLKENSSNLGTLKAFGLDNELLKSTYLKIVGWFLLRTLSPAIILTLIIGLLFQLFIGEYQVFSFFNPFVALAIIIIIGFSIMITRWTIGHILKHPPGDLIYQRFEA